jgi:hypothetical protein
LLRGILLYVGSFFVTLLLGFTFGRGISFEMIPERNEIVLNASLGEVWETERTEITESTEDLKIEGQRDEEIAEDVLGATAELLSPIPLETESTKPADNASLLETPTLTLTPSPQPTSTQIPSPTKVAIVSPTNVPPTATVTPSPTSTPVSSSLNTFDLITKYAGQYGVDAGLLRKIADCESHFNTNAVGAGGLYVGMFQFGLGKLARY